MIVFTIEPKPEDGDENQGVQDFEDFGIDALKAPHLQVEVWRVWCPEPIFWVVTAIGTARVECLNEGEPFNTQEVAVKRAIAESKRLKLPLRQDIIDTEY